MTTHLLYLHGFRSSPQSTKARKMAAWVGAHRPDVRWWCPQLPPSPRAAIELVAGGIAGWPRDGSTIAGSSLGGFYAWVVAERTGWPAVLLNPAVHPERDLAQHIGEQAPWHDPGERFFFEPSFVDELRALRPAALTRPERYFGIVAKGDEVLDWREMAALLAGCRVKLLEGSDHALSDFDEHLPDVVRFLRL